MLISECVSLQGEELMNIHFFFGRSLTINVLLRLNLLSQPIRDVLIGEMIGSPVVGGRRGGIKYEENINEKGTKEE